MQIHDVTVQMPLQLTPSIPPPPKCKCDQHEHKPQKQPQAAKHTNADPRRDSADATATDTVNTANTTVQVPPARAQATEATASREANECKSKP